MATLYAQVKVFIIWIFIHICARTFCVHKHHKHSFKLPLNFTFSLFAFQTAVKTCTIQFRSARYFSTCDTNRPGQFSWGKLLHDFLSTAWGIIRIQMSQIKKMDFKALTGRKAPYSKRTENSSAYRN